MQHCLCGWVLIFCWLHISWCKFCRISLLPEQKSLAQPFHRQIFLMRFKCFTHGVCLSGADLLSFYFLSNNLGFWQKDACVTQEKWKHKLTSLVRFPLQLVQLWCWMSAKIFNQNEKWNKLWSPHDKKSQLELACHMFCHLQRLLHPFIVSNSPAKANNQTSAGILSSFSTLRHCFRCQRLQTLTVKIQMVEMWLRPEHSACWTNAAFKHSKKASRALLKCFAVGFVLWKSKTSDDAMTDCTSNLQQTAVHAALLLSLIQLFQCFVNCNNCDMWLQNQSQCRGVALSCLKHLLFLSISSLIMREGNQLIVCCSGLICPKPVSAMFQTHLLQILMKWFGADMSCRWSCWHLWCNGQRDMKQHFVSSNSSCRVIFPRQWSLQPHSCFWWTQKLAGSASLCIGNRELTLLVSCHHTKMSAVAQTRSRAAVSWSTPNQFQSQSKCICWSCFRSGWG